MTIGRERGPLIYQNGGQLPAFFGVPVSFGRGIIEAGAQVFNLRLLGEVEGIGTLKGLAQSFNFEP